MTKGQEEEPKEILLEDSAEEVEQPRKKKKNREEFFMSSQLFNRKEAMQTIAGEEMSEEDRSEAFEILKAHLPVVARSHMIIALAHERTAWLIKKLPPEYFMDRRTYQFVTAVFFKAAQRSLDDNVDPMDVLRESIDDTVGVLYKMKDPFGIFIAAGYLGEGLKPKLNIDKQSSIKADPRSEYLDNISL